MPSSTSPIFDAIPIKVKDTQPDICASRIATVPAATTDPRLVPPEDQTQSAPPTSSTGNRPDSANSVTRKATMTRANSSARWRKVPMAPKATRSS